MSSTISFEAGSTTTVTNFTLAGTPNNLVTINSTIPGTRFILSKSSGNVEVSYLRIQDSEATGGAYWNATNGTNVNLGNNIGWDFPLSPINGQFFMFF
jgi:hypothetical protein